MKMQKEQSWQAYIDGELSATEAAVFEASLTESERDQLMADVRFDRALVERLAQNASCPDELWKNTKALLQQQGEAVPVAARRKRWYWGAASLVAAASLAFILSLFATPGTSTKTPQLIVSASTLEELRAQSEIESGRDAAQRYLDDKGVGLDISYDIALGIMGDHHHPIEIVGARQNIISGVPVTELLFGCCGKPIKVVVARHDSDAAQEIALAAAHHGQIQATRTVGDYFTAVVGDHAAHGLLDIFAKQD